MDIYHGKRILVTGHTGFKGSWLVLWLKMLGAEVCGIALPEYFEENHWSLLRLDIETHALDIRNLSDLKNLINKFKPDLIFHLAAQSLVINGYKDPINTFSTNIMGTANLLESCALNKNLSGVVVVTSDKCYENNEWIWGYRENDRLGGRDPYSASKAAAEILVSCYRHSFYSNRQSALIASVRGGNVIGGGDWSINRLVPDIVRSIDTGEKLKIRNPYATRPWQHVLDCLSGYLKLGEKLLAGEREFAEEWNFGPDVNCFRNVSDLLNLYKKNNKNLKWKIEKSSEPETQLLGLDSTKAKLKLGWSPKLTFEDTINWTSLWYSSYSEKREVLSSSQIKLYMSINKNI